jgi:LmbE family N-acetylglucosaminyl deacetylase
MDERKTILAFGAHPDDLELGCGATLAKLVEAGAHVRAVVFSHGYVGGSPVFDRAGETRAALLSLGVDDVHVHNLPDTRLHEHLNELITIMQGHARETEPDRVYTMFKEDRHQDHRAVHQASLVACRRVPQILAYETPSSYPNFVPTVFEAVGEHMERKVEALKLHESQAERLYMNEDMIRSAAHFRGVQVELGRAEGFIPYKIIF